jgi:hypothetical protein
MCGLNISERQCLLYLGQALLVKSNAVFSMGTGGSIMAL